MQDDAYRYPDPSDVIPRLGMRRVRHRQDETWDDAEARLLLGGIRSQRQGGVRVADIGAGTGRLALRIAPHVDQIVLIDPDEYRLGIAKTRAEAVGFANVAFVGQDLAAFSRTAERFDVVLCSHVIQHLASDQRLEFVGALARVTAPNGLLMLTFPSTTTARERLLISMISAERGVLTREVDGDTFDDAVAAAWHEQPTRQGASGLPVWHAAWDDVASIVRLRGFGEITQTVIREFEYDIETDSASATGTRIRQTKSAADVALFARRWPIGMR